MPQFSISDCIAAESPAQYFIDHAEDNTEEVLKLASPENITQLAKALSTYTAKEFEALTEKLVPLRKQSLLKDNIALIDNHLGAALLILNLPHSNSPMAIISEWAEDKYRPYDYLIEEMPSEQAQQIAMKLFENCSLIELYQVTEAIRLKYPSSALSLSLDKLAPHTILTKDIPKATHDATNWLNDKATQGVQGVQDTSHWLSAKATQGTQGVTSWLSAKANSITLGAKELCDLSMFRKPKEEPTEAKLEAQQEEASNNQPITEFK